MRKITAHFFISKFSSKYIGFSAKKTWALLADLFFTCKSTVCMMTWPGGEFSAIAYHFVCWLFTPSCARINLAAMKCQHKPGLPRNFINLYSVQMLNTSVTQDHYYSVNKTQSISCPAILCNNTQYHLLPCIANIVKHCNTTQDTSYNVYNKARRKGAKMRNYIERMIRKFR